MTGFKKKLFVFLFVLFAAVSLGLGLFFMPVKTDAAANDVQELNAAEDFVIEGGVFKGLSNSAYQKLSRAQFKITLPAGVTAIGDGNEKPSEGSSEQAPGTNALFGTMAQYLKGVSFVNAGSVTSIGYRAFVNCSALTDIDLGALTNLSSMESGVFRGCTSLAAVTVPAKITAVPEYTFMGCSALTSVTLNGSVTSIGASAFANCGLLSSFSFPSGLTAIGASAFYNCDSFVNIAVPNTVTQLGTYAFAGCNNLKTASLPDGITAIPAGIFQGCSSLGNFIIPANVKEIASEAFSNCIAFTEITIPAKIEKIESNAFAGLSGVTDIYYYASHAASVSRNPFVLTKYDNSSVTVHIGSSSQPAVNHIPQNLLAGHQAVKEVIFENVSLDSEQEFGAGAFIDCTSLAKVQFNSGCAIPVINSEAFSGCTALHTVEGIENIGLQTIGIKAFYGCSSLNSIVIGSNVSTIQESAFNGCERLLEVKNLSALTITAGDNGPNGCFVAANAKYVYGAGGQTRISTLNGYVFYADTTSATPEVWLTGYVGSDTNLRLPYVFTDGGQDYTYNIYRSAFKNNTSVTYIEIPNQTNCRTIEKSAFAGCTSLTGIKFPSTLLQVGENLFEGCTSLMTVDFNGSELSTISDNMFIRCSALQTITLPKKVVTVNSYAFSGCTNLRTVTFEKDRKNGVDTYNLTTLQGGAFSGCSALAAIQLPATVTSVGQNCFQDCGSLKFVYLPSGNGTAVTYGSNVFNGCPEDLILISADKAQYETDKNRNFGVDAKLTYTVNLVLKYNGEEYTVKKLYGMDGGYTQSGLVWTLTSSMPVQGSAIGSTDTQQYMISKWFETNSYQTEVTLDKLTEKLAADGVEEITLHARYFEHPNLMPEQNTTLTYDISKEYTIQDILKEMFRENGNPISDSRANEMVNTFNFNVVSHTFADGTEDTRWLWTNGSVISEAGTYAVDIKLRTDGMYGHWLNALRIEFTIECAEVYIDDYVIWKTESGSLAPAIEYDNAGNLKTTTLYFYNTNTPRLEKVGEPSETAEVAASYTVASGDLEENPVVLILDWVDDLHRYGEPVPGSYSGNIGTAAGTYTASVTLKPYSNYIFRYNTDSELQPKFRALGLAFTPLNDGTIVVRKTWYIAISNANLLLASGGGQFDIPRELTYNAEGMPLRPKLSQFDNLASSLLSFTLSFTDPNGNTVNFGNATNKIGIDNYERYFNKTMPAGNYVATFYIREHEGVMSDHEGTTYNFTVNEIPLTAADVQDVKSRLVDTKVPYTDEKLNFVSTDGIRLFDKLNPSRPQAVPYSGSPWYEYRDIYYTPFEIRYCVIKGEGNPGNDYFTESEYENGGSDMVKPQSIGTYTVYYKVSAPNYGGEITGSYKLSITHALRPLLSMYEYDGANVLNSVIRSLEKIDLKYFDIFTMLPDKNYLEPDVSDPLYLLYINTQSAPAGLRNTYFNHSNPGINDDYTAVGTHYIFLKIKEEYASYIIWDGTLGYKLESGGYLVLPVEIDMSDKALSVTEWETGRFDESVNAPVWNADFGSGTLIIYTMKLADGSSGKEYRHSNNDSFNATLDKGTLFSDAPAGTYVLTAHFTSGNIKPIEKTVVVHKVNIYFEKAPYIGGWYYGQLTANTASSDVIGYTLGKDIASQSEAINGKITFRFANAADYESRGTTVQSLSALAKDGIVPSGDYYVIIMRAEDDTYEKLEYAVKFSVLKTQNYLLEAPVNGQKFAKGTSAGDMRDMFKTSYGTAENVTVYYRVAGSDGAFEKAENFSQLERNQFKTGSYEMYAVIEGDNIATIRTEVIGFSIVDKLPSGGNADGDGISDTAVIAVIIVFAVIAVAVIAAGAAFAIIRNKKANAEYIKTVKSEMKRR